MVLVAAIGVAVYYSYSRTHQPAGSLTIKSSAKPSASPMASSGPAGSCQSANLSAELNKSGSAAGTTYYSLVLRNFGSQACTMNGYPGLSMVDSKGNVLGSPAARNAVIAPQTLSLAHGKAAYAQVRFPNPGNFSAGQCSADAAAMKVYPPDQTQALNVKSKLPYCPGFSTSAMSLTQQ
jgi:hypothetical protein